MGQFGAMMRSFGMRYGYYDPKDCVAARYCDPLIDCWGDLQGALGKFAFAPEDQKPPALENLITVMVRLNKLIEKGLAHHGGKFAAGNSMTIADFVLASYIGNFLQNGLNPASASVMAKIDETPKFKQYVTEAKDNFPYLTTRGPMTGPF